MKIQQLKCPKKIIALFLLLQLSLLKIDAQPGTLDYSFNAGTGGNERVTEIAIQADNKIIVGGRFSQFNGVAHNRITRLHPDGSTDSTFNPGIGFSTASGNHADILSIAVQPDGKLVIGGVFDFFNGVSCGNIVRLLSDGSIDSSFNVNLGNGADGNVFSVMVQPNGKILVGGWFNNFNTINSSFGATMLIRLNSDGSIDNTFTNNAIAGGFLPIPEISSIALQPDNKILIGGIFTSFGGVPCDNIARLNSDGSLDLSFNLGVNLTSSNSYVQIMKVLVCPNGKIMMSGDFNSCSGVPINSIARLDSNGILDSSFNPTEVTGLWIENMSLQSNGKIIAVGSFNLSYGGGNYSGQISRFNQDGSNDITFNPMPYYPTLLGLNSNGNSGLAIQPDGYILVGGNFNKFNWTIPVPNLIRLNKDKGIYCKVYNDIDANCINHVNEIGLANRIMTINPGNIIAYTNSGGICYIDSLPLGAYTITADTTQPNWIATCPHTQNFTVLYPDSIVLAPSFGFISTNPCSAPNISINMPFIRPCFNSQRIYVEACNHSTASGVLNNAYVKLELDSMITVNNCNLPYTDLGNNIYSINLGTLNPGMCTNFHMNVTLSCNAVLGQTLCLKANLYPVDSCNLDLIPNPFPSGINPCNTSYDYSHLVINQNCNNDTITFTIHNIGDSMSCFSQVRLFSDGVLSSVDSIQLISGDSTLFVFLGDGRTWRLEVDQHPLHPGNSQPSSTIERCGNIVNWTSNLVNILPHDDADPIIDIYCGLVTGSYDPNDKRGFPLGVNTTHDILPNQDIEYLINFQNTGTDTAFTVIIRDTLSTDLDIYSVRSGTASHDYGFRMYGPRVLEWTFNSIMLPDSNTNEPNSHGFVKFKIKQIPNLVNGTLIQNSAAIFFDFNAPIITNTSFHTINEDFILLEIDKVIHEQMKIKVYPNPTTGLIHIDRGSNQEIKILVVDNLGRLLLSKKSNNNITEINMGTFVSGVYYLSINNGKQTSTQKIIKQ